jgi:hypothetical protein
MKWQIHDFRQCFAARTVDQLVLDIVPETIVEPVDQGCFVVFDVLTETLKLSNVLCNGGGLAQLAKFSFGHDNQIRGAVNSGQGV